MFSWFFSILKDGSFTAETGMDKERETSLTLPEPASHVIHCLFLAVFQRLSDHTGSSLPMMTFTDLCPSAEELLSLHVSFSIQGQLVLMHPGSLTAVPVGLSVGRGVSQAPTHHSDFCLFGNFWADKRLLPNSSAACQDFALA